MKHPLMIVILIALALPAHGDVRVQFATGVGAFTSSVQFVDGKYNADLVTTARVPVANFEYTCFIDSSMLV